MRRTPLVLGLFYLAACSPAAEPELSPLAQEGKQLYDNVCIACHHGNPNKDGAIGPANAGASLELLEAKIVRGEYPPGYVPKRPGSAAMPRLPGLAKDLPALAAYMAEVEEPAPDASGDEEEDG